VPLGAPRLKLNFTNTDPAYVYRVVVDHPGRLEAAEQGGYEFVTDDAVKVGEGPEDERAMGSRIARHVGGAHSTGSAKMGYLMRIPRELYEQDQHDKDRHVTATEKAVILGTDASGGQDTSGRYVPDEGIHVHGPGVKQPIGVTGNG
jgi:hypothetical protein